MCYDPAPMDEERLRAWLVDLHLRETAKDDEIRDDIGRLRRLVIGGLIALAALVFLLR